jgi:phosphoglycerate dehydrogenase-like enzyme
MAHTHHPTPRLLVNTPVDEALRSALRQYLPEIAWEAIGPNSTGPWPTAEALLVGPIAGELPSRLPGGAPRLRFVQSIFVGLENFPFPRFGRAIRVSSNVGAYAPEVAEHALMLVLVLAKNFSPHLDRLRHGTLRPLSPVTNLRGRSVTLLGFGSVARETARRLRGMGMQIQALSRTGRPERGTIRMFSQSELSRAVSEADVVVDCRPLTRSTEGTIDRAVLGAMRSDAILVIVGRAGTVDENALYRHLRTNPLFRVGTDVWWHEDRRPDRLGRDQRFLRLPNFVGSPHNAGYSSSMDPRTRLRAYEMAAANLARFFRGRVPLHLADPGEYDPRRGPPRARRAARERLDEGPPRGKALGKRLIPRVPTNPEPA